MRIVISSIVASTKMLDRNDVVIRLTISRKASNVLEDWVTSILMDFSLNSRANFSWMAPPGGDLIFDSQPVVRAYSDQVPRLRCNVRIDHWGQGTNFSHHMTILIDRKDSPYRDVQNRSD